MHLWTLIFKTISIITKCSGSLLPLLMSPTCHFPLLPPLLLNKTSTTCTTSISVLTARQVAQALMADIVRNYTRRHLCRIQIDINGQARRGFDIYIISPRKIINIMSGAFGKAVREVEEEASFNSLLFCEADKLLTLSLRSTPPSAPPLKTPLACVGEITQPQPIHKH